MKNLQKIAKTIKATYLQSNGEYTHLVGSYGRVLYKSPEPIESGVYCANTLKERGLLVKDKNGTYGRFPEFKTEKIAEIEGENLKNLKKAIVCMSSDDLRPKMQRIWIDSDNIQATDGHRLFWKKHGLNIEKPITITKELLKVLLDQKSKIEVHLDPSGTYILTSNGVSVIIPEFTENNVDYRNVIPNSGMFEISVKLSDLLPVVVDSRKYVNRATNRIKLTVGDDVLKIHAEDIDWGLEKGYEINITQRFNVPEKFEIGFDAKFLEQILKTFDKKDVITFKMSQPNRATLINDEFLLMPVML